MGMFRIHYAVGIICYIQLVSGIIFAQRITWLASEGCSFELRITNGWGGSMSDRPESPMAAHSAVTLTGMWAPVRELTGSLKKITSRFFEVVIAKSIIPGKGLFSLYLVRVGDW